MLRERERLAPSPAAGSNGMRIVFPQVPAVTENDVILRMAGTAWNTGGPAADF
jgi:hypothetical protein